MHEVTGKSMPINSYSASIGYFVDLKGQFSATEIHFQSSGNLTLHFTLRVELREILKEVRLTFSSCRLGRNYPRASRKNIIYNIYLS